MTTYLKFINQDAVPKECEIALLSKGDIEPLMAWYGAFYAGDDYEVFVNGDKVEMDLNGCYEPLIIDAKRQNNLKLLPGGKKS